MGLEGYKSQEADSSQPFQDEGKLLFLTVSVTVHISFNYHKNVSLQSFLEYYHVRTHG